MIHLDGAEGEGGGQILRSSLALSILTGQPFKLINIRAGRPKPGLAAQHLASVRAAAAISQANCQGAALGSTSLTFSPNAVKAGPYDFRINTAGATSLVLHTVYLPLALRGDGPSELTITGGTHVAHSPCFDFLNDTWAAYLRLLGLKLELEILRPGFYPRGGGEIKARIEACASLTSLRLKQQAELKTASGFCAVANLDEGIGKRMARRLTERLQRAGLEASIEQRQWSGGPGAVAVVQFQQTPVPTTFAAIGERGRPAEVVADQVASEAIAYATAGASVDPHSADQLLLPLAFAPNESSFHVSEVTRHLTTNITVIQKFLDRQITCDAEIGSSGTVRFSTT